MLHTLSVARGDADARIGRVRRARSFIFFVLVLVLVVEVCIVPEVDE